MSNRSIVSYRTCAIVAAACGALSVSSFAQWSTNAAANLTIAGRTGPQVQGKIKILPGGGCYITWYDNAAGGYDTYITKLDAQGVPEWTPADRRIVDTSFSSTQDYGLDVDGAGNAVVAYRDDTITPNQIAVQIVHPDGTFAFAPTGLRVSNAASGISVLNPKVAATSDGHYVATWSQNSTLGMQRFDSNGMLEWTPGGILNVPTTGSNNNSFIVGSDAGSVIVLWVRQTGNINSNKYLYTQKFSTAGAPMWNSGNPVVVFDGTSVQIGYFPTFIGDGAGGAVFGWYEIGSNRRAYVQHINANGTERFAHNGVAMAMPSGRIMLTPSVAYNRDTNDIFLTWSESSIAAPTTYSVSAQRVHDGAIQWGSLGKLIIGPNSNQPNYMTALATSDNGMMVYWFEKPTTPRVLGTRLTEAGEFAWTPNIIEVTSNTSTKDRLFGAMAPGDCAYLVWNDARVDDSNLVGQVVNGNSTLGPCAGAPCAADFNGDGGVDGGDVEAFFVDFSDGLSTADVNGDGGVDGADVEFFFTVWSAGGCF